MGNINTPVKRGRSAELILLRDECILYRLYYYTNILGKNYTDATEAISKEFFITHKNVMHRIQQHSGVMKKIRQVKPAYSFLTSRYPFFNWELK